MSDFVYLIGSKNAKTGVLDAVKIGIANDPRKRLKNLQTASHAKLILLSRDRCFDVKEARSYEQFIHLVFKDFRIRGEWFTKDVLLSLRGLYRLNFDKPCDFTGDSIWTAAYIYENNKRLKEGRKRIYGYSLTND